MTVALYARRKGWALAGVTVRLRHSRIHAADCAECETKEGMLDRIEREISLDGALPGPSDADVRDQHPDAAGVRGERGGDTMTGPGEMT